MKIENTFEVPLPPSQAWDVLLDLPRIAPCMPGAKLLSSSGATHVGEVSVRLGPIILSFKGNAEFVERDDAAKTAKVKAQGRDSKGRGGANALVVFSVESIDAGSRVHVLTDLNLTGSVAQYGRGAGMITDVSNHLVGEFAQNLRGVLAADQASKVHESSMPKIGAQPVAVEHDSGSATPISGLKMLLIMIRSLFHFGAKKTS